MILSWIVGFADMILFQIKTGVASGMIRAHAASKDHQKDTVTAGEGEEEMQKKEEEAEEDEEDDENEEDQEDKEEEEEEDE